MGVKHFLSATGFALLFAGWVQASTITEPGHFIVDLNDVPGVDSGGWGAETLFTDLVNTINSSKGFTQSICVDTDSDHPNSDDPDCEGDPRMAVNGGGGSIPFPSSFNADENGGGAFSFFNNTNSPFTDILFTTVFNANQTYTCASDIYNFCGFQVIHQMNGADQLEILFIGGTIPVATPEPSEYSFLLGMCAAIAVVHRLRSQRVSA